MGAIMIVTHIIGIEERNTEVVSTSLMHPGDIAEIVSSDVNPLLLRSGYFLLRTFGEFVLLNEPARTWGTETYLGQVKILPPGTVLKIKVGGA